MLIHKTLPEIIFLLSISIVLYTYIGYMIVIIVAVKVNRIFARKKFFTENFTPEISFIIPCFNEELILEEKIKNTLLLDYPKDKMNIVFITDGSTDESVALLSKYETIKLLHQDERRGKSAAENRAVKNISTPIVIFSDANTYVNKEAIKEIVKHYQDEHVGAVSGEKKIAETENATVSAAGEGMYWKYESLLKRYDSELNTLVGAAGELVSFRTDLWEDLEEDIILDDFVQSLRIAAKGYKVVYEPSAFATEAASVSINEELKRKIRICAGGWQSIVRLKKLLNPFAKPLLSFQYISHRVLRWSLAPLALLAAFISNAFLLNSGNRSYDMLFLLQVLFYAIAMLGGYLKKKHVKIKGILIPYYFFIMNYAVYIGFFRFVMGRQSSIWEKAARE